MTSRVPAFQAKAAQCEKWAEKTRDPKNREWQKTLARAYLILAEVETESAVSVNHRERTSILGDSPTASRGSSLASPTSGDEDSARASSGQAPQSRLSVSR
jgi:hypothetical protein